MYATVLAVRYGQQGLLAICAPGIPNMTSYRAFLAQPTRTKKKGKKTSKEECPGATAQEAQRNPSLDGAQRTTHRNAVQSTPDNCVH